eukprot:6478556-Amphidinium_carterae.1
MSWACAAMKKAKKVLFCSWRSSCKRWATWCALLRWTQPYSSKHHARGVLLITRPIRTCVTPKKIIIRSGLELLPILKRIALRPLCTIRRTSKFGRSATKLSPSEYTQNLVHREAILLEHCHDNARPSFIWHEATAAKTISRSPFMLSAANCKRLPSCVIAHLYLDCMSSHNAESVNTPWERRVRILSGACLPCCLRNILHLPWVYD